MTARLALGFLLLVLVAGASTAQQPVPVGDEFQVNTYTTDGQYFAAASPDGSGGFVVVWQSDGSSGTDSSASSIQGQRFAAEGSPVGSQFQVNTYTTFNQRLAAVSPDGAGGFVVVWNSDGSNGSDGSGDSILGQRFASNGSVIGGEFQVNTYTTGDQTSPTVAPDGAGGFIVAWASDGSGGTDTNGFSLQAQRFDSAGTPIGSQFQVNTYTTGAQVDANLSSDGGSGLVVVWRSSGSPGTDSDGYSVQGQRLASDGTPAGGQFQVNTDTAGAQQEPAASPDGAGGFVVVWRSANPASNITGQRFTADGVPLGSEFQVETYASSLQFAPEVQLDGSGGFTVAWGSIGSSGTDNDETSTQGQRFRSDGTPAGVEFQVNTYTTGIQDGATILADGADGFFVFWDSSGSAGTDDFSSVQGQRYLLPDIFTDGFESCDTSAWSNTVP